MRKTDERETLVPIIPANIRVDGVAVDDEDRAHIRRRVRTVFGRYGRALERVTVRIRDVNGPRGGVDIMTRIKVVLSGLPSAVAERRTATLKSSFNGALAAAARSVTQTMRRRRMRHIKPAARSRRRVP
jgi:hypothetical protein